MIGVLDIISGGSRSTTPTSLLTRKSPTIDQGSQTAQHQSNNIGKIGDKQMRGGPGAHRDRDRYTMKFDSFYKKLSCKVFEFEILN